MASRSNGNGAKTPTAEKKNPLYHVVLVDPEDKGKFEIVAFAVEAPTQEKAMDKVSESREGEYTLGAFLASSLKAKTYVRKMQPVTEGTTIDLFGTLSDAAATPVPR